MIFGAPPQPFIRIAVIENAFEAQVVKAVLKEQHIPHHIRSHHDTAFDGLFQARLGWGELHAPETFQQDIHRILDQLRKGNQPPGQGAPLDDRPHPESQTP